MEITGSCKVVQSLFLLGSFLGSCLGSRLVRVLVVLVGGRVRVWCMSGSCLVRVRIVISACPVRVWFMKCNYSFISTTFVGIFGRALNRIIL